MPQKPIIFDESIFYNLTYGWEHVNKSAPSQEESLQRGDYELLQDLLTKVRCRLEAGDAAAGARGGPRVGRAAILMAHSLSLPQVGLQEFLQSDGENSQIMYSKKGSDTSGGQQQV